MGVDSSYTRFAYSYARSAHTAFAEECRNYHDFGANHGLDNETHPIPMRGSSAECPASTARMPLRAATARPSATIIP
jgi:hypothetical protein